MNRIKQFFSGLVQNVWFGIKTSYRASKFYFAMKLLILLSTTAIPIVNIRLWREVLNGIVVGSEGAKAVVVYLSRRLPFA